MAKVTYHKSHSFTTTDENRKVQFKTQLYILGVYTIINDNPSLQSILKPQQIKKIEKLLKKDKEEKKIKNLKFGKPITVTDESGHWKEIKDE